MGAWTSIESAIKPLGSSKSEGTLTLLSSIEGQVLNHNNYGFTDLELGDKYRFDNENNRYLQVTQVSSTGEFFLTSLTPDLYLSNELKTIRNLTFGLSIVAIVTLIIAMIVIERITCKPLYQLAKVMETVKGGTLTAKISDKTNLREFSLVQRTFNEMLDEIGKLKIDIYEQELLQKETHLQYLQLQIHPHFFLNSMNLINSLAQLKRYEEIQILAQHMVSYFRFRFQKPTVLIQLHSELEHVQSYMEIQKMRFQGKVEYTAQIDEGIADTLIPPLIVQTFVENAVKYAFGVNDITKIRVKAQALGDKIRLSIIDNGNGYSLEQLKQLNNSESLSSNTNSAQIGIKNVRLRLELIWHCESYIHFYNADGAVVELVLPMQKE